MKNLYFFDIISNIFIFGQAPTNGLVAYYGFESNVNSHDSQNNFTAASNTTATISYNSSKEEVSIFSRSNRNY